MAVHIFGINEELYLYALALRNALSNVALRSGMIDINLVISVNIKAQYSKKLKFDTIGNLCSKMWIFKSKL